jgi:hypothetical protein
MKKVNLKGKLGLSKETITKFEMGNVTGGATIAGCGLSKNCGTSFGLPCLTICGTSNNKCEPSSPTVC